MGTRGYITVKYNKKYYTRYNGMDSYPEDLGKKIVDHLEYLKWHHPDIDKEQYKEYILSVVKDNCTEISEKEPETTHMIEWIYVVDVDEMTFSIKGGYYEPVYKIKQLLQEEDSESSESSGTEYETYQEKIDNYKPRWLKDFQKNNEKLAEEKKNEPRKVFSLARPL